MLLSTFLAVNAGETQTNTPPAVVLNNNGALPVVNVGHTLSLSGSFTDPDSRHWLATVQYGDGTATLLPLLAPDHTFTFDHVYEHEGNYLITVAITDDSGATGYLSLPIAVYDTSMDIGQIGQGTAPPGGSVNINAPGITATLQRDGADLASEYAYLLVAPVGDNEIERLGGGSLPFQPGTPFSAYDIRSVNLTAQDKAIVTFQYPAGLDLPTLQYFDPVSHSFQPVLGSTLAGVSIRIDSEHHTLTLTFDASSTPHLDDLTGTVFVVSASQSQGVGDSPPGPSPISSPPSVSPPTGASSTPTTETTMIGMGGLGGASSATAGTTATPSTSILMALQSGAPSAFASAGSTQLVSNSSSAEGISAFSPFFVLVITAARPSVLESEAESGAAAGAEPNTSTAPAPNVPSLLNRLPRVPVSEDNFTPPDSGPNAVLSPSRAGLPEGTGKSSPSPAPLPLPPAGNAPPVGLRFQPAETQPDEAPLGSDLFSVPPVVLPRAAVSGNTSEGGDDWFEGVLTELLGKLAWSNREREHAALHPGIAILALCAGLAPRWVRRTPPTARRGGRLFEDFAE